VAIVALMAAIFWGLGQRINDLQAQADIEAQANISVKFYLQDAMQGLYRNAGVVDAQAARVYMPELKIYLPLNQNTRDLRYFYNPDSTPAEAQFSTATSLTRPIQSWGDVPCQQRLAALSVNTQDKGLQGMYGQSAGTLKLADGRTIYFYISNSKGCANYWQPHTPQSIVNLLKQAQSY